MKHLNRVLQVFMLALFALLVFLGIAVWIVSNPGHRSYMVSLLLGVISAIVLMLLRTRITKLRTWLNNLRPAYVAAAFFLLCITLNGLLVFCFQPVQAPDFQTFWTAAKDLAEGQSPSASQYLALFPHILGYSWFLSLFLRFFGSSILTAALVNVVLNALAGLSVFYLCKLWSDTADAAVAFLIWILCPSRLLYSTMCLSEPYYTCLLMLFFLLIAGMERNGNAWRLVVFFVSGLLAGVLLRGINTARPIGIIPIIALVIWKLLLDDTKKDRKKTARWGVFFLTMLISYWCLGTVWNRYTAEILGQPPASVPGYSIYVGLNPETKGTYSDEDMELLTERYRDSDYDADAAQRSMLETAKERFHSLGASVPKLILHKLGTLLGYDEGGAYYSKESLSPRSYAILCVLSNVWYYCIVLLALLGSLRVIEIRRSALLLPLFAIGLILAQVIVEVAARYHYALVPVFLVMAMAAGPGSKTWTREKGSA